IDRALGLFASRIAQGARTVPMMMAALSAYHAGMSQVVISGDRSDFMDVVRRRYLPFAVIVPLAAEQAGAIAKLLPWTEAMARRAGTPLAYVCRSFACQAPASSATELGAQLEALRP